MKTRADLLLVARGLFESRAKARAAIEAGGVTADGRVVAKASELLADDAVIEAVPALAGMSGSCWVRRPLPRTAS